MISLLERSFATILQMSLTASYVILVVLVARYMLQRAPRQFSYALWSVVLFRLLCPTSFSSAFSLLGPLRPTNGLLLVTGRIAAAASGQASPSTVGSGAAGASAVLQTGVSNAAQSSASFSWLGLVAAVWLAGLVAFLVYAVVAHQRLRRQISTATRVSAGLYATDQIQSPFVCGLFRPCIYLPLSLEGSERELILCHEQTHIRRRDYLLKPIAFLALALHWFNPLVWLSFTLATQDMEMSCDELVIRRTSPLAVVSYSRSLLALATQPRLPSPSPLAFGESNVKSRITNLLRYRQPVLRVTALALIAVSVLLLVLVTNPIAGFSIYQHPDQLYGVEQLLAPTALQLYDRQTNTEYLATDVAEVAELLAIVQDMRLAKRPISPASAMKATSRYILAVPGDIASEFVPAYTMQLAPVWLGRGSVTTPTYKLINWQQIYQWLEQFLASKATSSSYDLASLSQHKTHYVGNASEVGALLRALPLPVGVLRGQMQLRTEQPPYSLSVTYKLQDDSLQVAEQQFFNNSVLLFACIDNLSAVDHYAMWNNQLLSSMAFAHSYTREEIERVIGGDVRKFANSETQLAELIRIAKAVDISKIRNR